MKDFSSVAFGVGHDHGHEHDDHEEHDHEEDIAPEVAATVYETVDAASNTSTPYTINVGDTFIGDLDDDTGFGSDWVGLNLTAGQTITITLNGSGGDPVNDPYLALLSPSGTFISSGNAGGSSSQAQITYTATTSGKYYVSAESWNYTDGDYTLSVTGSEPPPPPPPSSNDPLDALDWGSKLSSTTVDVYFGVNGFSADGITSEGFNAFQKAQFMAVFDLIESVSGLTFNVVNTAAQADFKLIMDTDEMANGLYGYMNPPGYASGSSAGVGAFNQDMIDSIAGGNMDKGGLGWYVIVHELLHGLGLAHPHDTGGNGVGNDSTILDGVSSSSSVGDYMLNQGHYTIMSYNWEFTAGDVGTAGDPYLWGMAAGPGALDIAVLQEKYGANTTHASGATTYMLGDVHGDGSFWQAIWDTGGKDVIQYNGSKDAVIDLRTATLQQEVNGGGFNSAVDGVAGGYTIANGVLIENATGGSGDDLLQGNGGKNTLTGNGGLDTLNGGNGNDTLDGGNGNDSLSGGGGADELLGGAGNDSLFGQNGVDEIYGGANNDSISGGNKADKLYGDEGNDTVAGGVGGDALFGGDDNDLLNGQAGHDDLKGNSGNDTLNGGTGNDTLNGGNDDDLLKGNNGADDISGANGNDTIIGGYGDDTLNGGRDNDVITAGRGADVVTGGAGNDNLDGGNGRDTLEAGAGNDTLTGGFGRDEFVFNDGDGINEITDFQVGRDTLKLDSDLTGSASNGQDVIDMFGSKVGNVLTLTFDDGTIITLDGANNANLDQDILIF